MTTVKNARYADVLAEAQPRELIVTIYGLYARDEHNWLPIAAVVRLMSDLGVDGQAVRSSISRLKRRDTLQSRRVDGAAGYALAPAMLAVLREGDRRIFEHGRASLVDGWVQVVFSVPESERDKRHELRSRLAGLAFGPVAPGVWVAPGTLADEVRAVLARRRLAGYVDIFRGEHLGYAPLRGRVRDWWDLDAIAAGYAQFAARFRPLQRRIARRVPPAQDAFAEYVPLLTAWRRLRYLDPGLPVEVLPARWPGAAATQLFDALNQALRPLAQSHFSRVVTSSRGQGDVKG